MLCSRPMSLKQRAPNDLLPRHGRKPSREAGSFSGQVAPGCFAPIPTIRSAFAAGFLHSVGTPPETSNEAMPACNA